MILKMKLLFKNRIRIDMSYKKKESNCKKIKQDRTQS
jgi:hypothetical protein